MNAVDVSFIPLIRQLDTLPADWKAVLTPCIAQTDWSELCIFIGGERAAGKPTFPTSVFRALRLAPADDVRVIIFGQDPHHGTGAVDGREIPQTHGLAFSVPAGIRVSLSLHNIYREIRAEFGYELPGISGNLEGWAQQGMLLLNMVLTAEQGQATNHVKRGWERITDCLLEQLAHVGHKRTLMLWGSHAQVKCALLSDGHLVLETPHPLSLSAHRGFLRCEYFKMMNDWLTVQHQLTIDQLKSRVA